jgi:hypothetical protein
MEHAGPNVPRAVMGDVREHVWTTIAADIDGVPQPEEVGQRRLRRKVMFAFKAEAEEWLTAQEAEGFERSHGPTPCAAPYFGETDSVSNCWSCEVEQIKEET